MHDELATQGKLRMDIVGSRAAAERSFADGARLIVYNLTATVMAHLADLRSVSST